MVKEAYHFSRKNENKFKVEYNDEAHRSQQMMFLIIGFVLMIVSGGGLALIFIIMGIYMVMSDKRWKVTGSKTKKKIKVTVRTSYCNERKMTFDLEDVVGIGYAHTSGNFYTLRLVTTKGFEMLSANVGKMSMKDVGDEASDMIQLWRQELGMPILPMTNDYVRVKTAPATQLPPIMMPPMAPPQPMPETLNMQVPDQGYGPGYGPAPPPGGQPQQNQFVVQSSFPAQEPQQLNYNAAAAYPNAGPVLAPGQAAPADLQQQQQQQQGGYQPYNTQGAGGYAI